MPGKKLCFRRSEPFMRHREVQATKSDREISWDSSRQGFADRQVETCVVLIPVREPPNRRRQITHVISLLQSGGRQIVGRKADQNPERRQQGAGVVEAMLK